MARILFVHPYFPGQFLWLARHLSSSGQHEVKALSLDLADGRESPQIDGIETLIYGAEVIVDRPPRHVLNPTESFIRYAASLALKAEGLRQSGFYPDIVYSHTGWGASTFLHHVFPGARYVKYCEWFYNQPGTGMRFLNSGLPVEQLITDELLNLPLLGELAHFDRLVAPTEWQRQQFPEPYRERITVIPDGLDPSLFESPETQGFRLDDGRMLTASDRIVTYVARGADMFRGFETFMRAVALLQAKDPGFQCLVACDTKAFYGPGHGTDAYYRSVMEKVHIDRSRVHFLGTVKRARFTEMLRVSSVHVYLTVPFVLSWSLIEAMAAGCVVVASGTPPVKEFLTDGVNGHLVDFFDAEQLSSRIFSSFADGAEDAEIRIRARDTARQRWSLDRALKAHMDLLEGLPAK